MVGNRFSYNGYSYTRAPTLDWGDAPGGAPPTVVFDRGHATARRGRPLEPLLAWSRRTWACATSASRCARRSRRPGASQYNFPPGGGGQRYMMLGREAIILNYTASAAWKFRDVFGVGATAAVDRGAAPRLFADDRRDAVRQDVANPVSSPLDMLASTSGSDRFTFNAILGAWVRPVPVPAVRRGGAGRARRTS